MKVVSNGVVDLLTNKLQRLSEGYGLSWARGFIRHTGDHVRDMCGQPDIGAGLEHATKESLIYELTL